MLLPVQSGRFVTLTVLIPLCLPSCATSALWKWAGEAVVPPGQRLKPVGVVPGEAPVDVDRITLKATGYSAAHFQIDIPRDWQTRPLTDDATLGLRLEPPVPFLAAPAFDLGSPSRPILDLKAGRDEPGGEIPYGYVAGEPGYIMIYGAHEERAAWVYLGSVWPPESEERQWTTSVFRTSLAVLGTPGAVMVDVVIVAGTVAFVTLPYWITSVV